MIMDDRQEWLEADGLGGFASGTVLGARTRRYHALLLPATTPPTGRMVLVGGFDAWIITSSGRVALSTQRYNPGVLHPDGYQRITRFSASPWPTWDFEAEGLHVRQEIIVEHGRGATAVVWQLVEAPDAATLEVRPFFAGRDYHAMQHENGAFRFDPVRHDRDDERQTTTMMWTPYDGVPSIAVLTDGVYAHAPAWYRNFLYRIERERGLDDSEDLASPGSYSWRLTPGAEAVVVFEAGAFAVPDASAVERAAAIRAAERARRAVFTAPLDRAADAYLVKRGDGKTIVAGYPWFTDWGRDTFISLRGLCIATGRLADARAILLQWAGAVSEGMLPNRFPDGGETPEFNAVDASLWYVIAVHDLLERAGTNEEVVSRADRDRLLHAVRQILEGYAAGTRYGIRADDDGLLSSGQPGVQLTWMDARVEGREITPRTGKPVEVQALWLNALWFASQHDARWRDLFERGRASFVDHFWNGDRACLYDVIDVDHIPGVSDGTLRPNQIFAVGGLPLQLVEGERAQQIVDRVEQDLLTPTGLRSMARSEPGYAAHYEGPPNQRDGVYHQGTVWPWLLGAFVDAWIRVRGGTDAARREARERFVQPLLDDVIANGSGHLCEITDAEPPFTARGCPFQAWSLGELIRMDRATSGPSQADSLASTTRDARLTSTAQ